ncbi:MAG: aldolase [Candidatus Aenigmarchaeota archaeon]|nr:aldolase [Candidatus Aenigmarchaeota archaeon]
MFIFLSLIVYLKYVINMKLTKEDIKVPLDVPIEKKETYVENFLKITKSTGRLMLYAGDQKMEHLNDDFFGAGISAQDNDPEHLFRIAKNSTIGVFATQFGLISKYAMDYKEVPYLVKVNSKTHLIKKDISDPYSGQLVEVKDIIDLKKNSGIDILAVGYTLYLGSEYEDKMLSQASRLICDAHKNGLLVVLWIYPRGKSVTDEKDSHLIAGATGVAASLGADFVKVNYPSKPGENTPDVFKEAVISAGRTKVVCAGGSSDNPETFLQRLYDQIHISGAMGNATGRNIHQKSLDEAISMCNAISAITLDNKTVDEAMKIYNRK